MTTGNGDDRDDKIPYKVVMNQEEQYSIWPADRENAPGWREVGKSGSKRECLDYIEQVWVDMRPLSLRKQMEEAARSPAPPLAAAPAPPAEGDDLVGTLCKGDHPVEVSLHPEKTVEAFKECIDRGYVPIKFTDTRGGTELGIRPDLGVSDLRRADFEKRLGKVRLVGVLTLNFVKVRCVAEIDLATLAGQGHLEVVAG